MIGLRGAVASVALAVAAAACGFTGGAPARTGTTGTAGTPSTSTVATRPPPPTTTDGSTLAAPTLLPVVSVRWPSGSTVAAVTEAGGRLLVALARSAGRTGALEVVDPMHPGQPTTIVAAGTYLTGVVSVGRTTWVLDGTSPGSEDGHHTVEVYESGTAPRGLFDDPNTYALEVVGSRAVALSVAGAGVTVRLLSARAVTTVHTVSAAVIASADAVAVLGGSVAQLEARPDGSLVVDVFDPATGRVLERTDSGLRGDAGSLWATPDGVYVTGSSGSLRRLHTGAWSTVRGCPARLTAIVPIGAAAIAVGSDEAGNAQAATLAADACGPSVAIPDLIGRPWGVLVDTAWFVTASGISGIR